MLLNAYMFYADPILKSVSYTHLDVYKRQVTACDRSPVTDSRKTADGQLIVTLTDQQGARLLMLKKIGEIEVEGSPYHSENYKGSGGVPCLNYTKEEIAT